MYGECRLDLQNKYWSQGLCLWVKWHRHRLLVHLNLQPRHWRENKKTVITFCSYIDVTSLCPQWTGGNKNRSHPRRWRLHFSVHAIILHFKSYIDIICALVCVMCKSVQSHLWEIVCSGSVLADLCTSTPTDLQTHIHDISQQTLRHKRTTKMAGTHSLNQKSTIT